MLAGLGYFVNLIFVRRARDKTQMLYVMQDYERGLYYEQYISRAMLILLGLFLDVERIHKRIFQENYEPDVRPSAVRAVIDDILAGVHSTCCPYVHKHMADKTVTPELWTLCESGNAEGVRMCPHWEGSRERSGAKK